MAYTFPEGCFFDTIDQIKDSHVTIMGLGLNGGGEACVRFFLKHGAFVTVTDKKTAEELSPTISSIASDKSLDLSKLTYVLGTHREEDFANADCVIKNPGVKIEGNEYLALAKAIETDISIFLHFTKAPIIAVTGSKGKSSTVSAIHYGLTQAGFTTFLGGNITVSPLTFLDETNENTPVVLELSSWQLADLRGRKSLKPKIAVITKIVPDHQNWYHSMDKYVEDKKLIYADQSSEDYTILDADDDGYLTESESPVKGITCWGDLFASETKGTVLRYSKKELRQGVYGVFQKNDSDATKGFSVLPSEEKAELVMDRLLVPGEHMKTNVLNACLVMSLMGIPSAVCKTIAGNWKGIENRLEYFHEYKTSIGTKVSFFNDTCATVPEAAAAAAGSFDKPVILLAGGTDKGLELTPLAKAITGEENSAYKPLETYLLAGSATDKIIPYLEQKKCAYKGPFASLEEMLSSLKQALEIRSENELTVVFSPGATSFGMFTNEFDRGKKFKDSVLSIFSK